MTLKEQILLAAKADSIPAGMSGLWKVGKFSLSLPISCPDSRGSLVTLPPGSYTTLTRWTLKTLNQTIGELVMHDVPHEINKHLDFALRARGRVLITGLGLGCVARMCLANPAVRHVVVIERDPHVLKLVSSHMTDRRLTIIMADAVEWVKKCPRPFDCAWHDLWSDPDKEEQHLQLTHMELIKAMAPKVQMQGAWELPRICRRRAMHFAKVI